MNLREPLPRLLLIGDRFTDPSVGSRIAEAVKCGVRWVQLRDHDADTGSFISSATSLVELLRAVRPDILISMNTRVGAAELLGCALHVGKRGPRVEEARALVQAGLPIGRSVHVLEDIGSESSDYALWSPVFETTSKPGHPGTGLEQLKEACALAKKMPVIAMGGITPDRVRLSTEAGAFGVAVLSGILNARNVHDTVNEYLDELKQ